MYTTLYVYSVLSVSLVRVKLRDSDVLASVQGQGKIVKYWTRFCCCISPFYDPFSLGARIETYETFIYLIFQIFLGRGNPRILN
jgi:hypothetical protein